MLIETKMINYAVPHLVEIKVVFHDCKKAFVPLYLFLHFLRVRFLSCNILLLFKRCKYTLISSKKKHPVINKIKIT